jgi:hypothetical protein
MKLNTSKEYRNSRAHLIRHEFAARDVVCGLEAKLGSIRIVRRDFKKLIPVNQTSDLEAMCDRRRSPVERMVALKSRAMLAAIVPLPLPGALCTQTQIQTTITFGPAGLTMTQQTPAGSPGTMKHLHASCISPTGPVWLCSHACMHPTCPHSTTRSHHRKTNNASLHSITLVTRARHQRRPRHSPGCVGAHHQGHHACAPQRRSTRGLCAVNRFPPANAPIVRRTHFPGFGKRAREH